ncbi:hypothetical protein Vadar_005515 [Vaccinium darrowii]|uniref:Uncharacterized protein n=1 Tax=Vaccinium darrowii TaxID=229202 RepID=A0ACB7XFK4_9ERIC|nr:hypothetical protein Vadar_005515 [Vaccinium darrowii]
MRNYKKQKFQMEGVRSNDQLNLPLPTEAKPMASAEAEIPFVDLIYIGLVKYIPLEDMKNRKVCVLCNLKPAKKKLIPSAMSLRNMESILLGFGCFPTEVTGLVIYLFGWNSTWFWLLSYGSYRACYLSLWLDVSFLNVSGRTCPHVTRLDPSLQATGQVCSNENSKLIEVVRMLEVHTVLD